MKTKYNWKQKLAAWAALLSIGLWSVPGEAAITFSQSNVQGPFSIGGHSKVYITQLNLAGTYATGGFAVTAADFGLSTIEQVVVQGEDGYEFYWNRATGKIMVLNAPNSAGTLANESAHTHAVALDGGVSDATSAGTPAGTNGSSTVEPYLNADPDGAVAPAIALTHNADCAAGLSANPLYALQESLSSQNIVTLESNNNGAAGVSGETADGTVHGSAASVRFWVEHDATPEGVQIYVDEANGDQLEFVSPTDTDAFIVMPFEAVAGVPQGYGVIVRIHDDDTAATGKPLAFDDNGAADAQLCFTDTGGVGGTVPAADVTLTVPSFVGNGQDRGGVAAAQTFTGDAMGTHTHGPGTLADAASGAGSAHTHTYTGSGAGALAEVSNGVSLANVDQINVIVVGW